MKLLILFSTLLFLVSCGDSGFNLLAPSVSSPSNNLGYAPDSLSGDNNISGGFMLVQGRCSPPIRVELVASDTTVVSSPTQITYTVSPDVDLNSGSASVVEVFSSLANCNASVSTTNLIIPAGLTYNEFFVKTDGGGYIDLRFHPISYTAGTMVGVASGANSVTPGVFATATTQMPITTVSGTFSAVSGTCAGPFYVMPVDENDAVVAAEVSTSTIVQLDSLNANVYNDVACTQNIYPDLLMGNTSSDAFYIQTQQNTPQDVTVVLQGFTNDTTGIGYYVTSGTVRFGP